MRSFLINLKNNEEVKYLFFSIIEKGLNFVLPILILRLFGKDKYNNVEYIYAWASIFLSFIDGGLIKYMFYGYTQPNSQYFKTLNTVNYYHSVVLFFLGLSVFLIRRDILILFIILRLSYVYISSYLNYFYRLIGKPFQVFKIIIPVNIVDIMAILLIYKFELTEVVLYPYFLIQAIPLILYFSGFSSRGIGYNKIINFYKKALAYAWPVIINSAIMIFVENYAKVYAFNYLGEHEMTSISFILRSVIVIQVVHAAIIAYQTREIYLLDSYTISLSKYVRYIIFNGLITLFVFVFLFVVKELNVVKLSSLSVFLGVIYIFIKTNLSYFEIYLNKEGINQFILYSSIGGAVVYLLLILTLDLSVFRLLIIMNVSVIAVAVILLITFYKNKFELDRK